MVVPLPSLRNNDETGVVHPQTSKHNPPVWEGMGTEDTKQAVSHAFIKAAVQTLCKLSTLCDDAFALLCPLSSAPCGHCGQGGDAAALPTHSGVPVLLLQKPGAC